MNLAGVWLLGSAALAAHLICRLCLFHIQETSTGMKPLFENLAMASYPDQHHLFPDFPVDNQRVSADVKFSEALPATLKSTISRLRRKGSIVSQKTQIFYILLKLSIRHSYFLEVLEKLLMPSEFQPQ